VKRYPDQNFEKAQRVFEAWWDDAVKWCIGPHELEHKELARVAFHTGYEAARRRKERK